MQLLYGTLLLKINNDEFVLFNNKLKNRILINEDIARIIGFLFNKKGQLFWYYRFIPRCKEIINSLKENGFLVKEKNSDNFFINLKSFDVERPLTAFNIELMNNCNLNCSHCYGAFGDNVIKNNLNYTNICNILDELYNLNCYNLTLTGGECTLHPEFDKIVKEILIRGFNLGIMTNGFFNKNLINILDEVDNYNFTVKVSLDGLEHTHNKIRKNNKSFINAIKLIDNLYERNNIKLIISSTLMKSNFLEFRELINFVKNSYPRSMHSLDVVLPTGKAKIGDKESFNIEELNKIRKVYPEIFNISENYIKKEDFRCNGGISQATLTASGKLKICNCACDERFFFKGNVLKDGLTYVWNNPGNNVKNYRNEKRYTETKCYGCIKKDKCNIVDCRVAALAYKGSDAYCSPITYMIS